MLTTEIFFNEPAVDIVCSPYLVGKELEEKAFEASVTFFRRYGAFKNPVELVILEGGKYYHIADAYEFVYGYRPLHAHIDSKRTFSGVWSARISNLALNNISDNQTILIGDTIATGISLRTVIETVMRYADGKGISLGPIHVFTIAGSKDCIERLSDLDVDLTIFYANAAYALADNGTDLLFEGARYNPLAKEKIKQKLGEFDSKMKCAVWDWGDRFRNPQKHLEEIYAYYSSVNAPDWIINNTEYRLRNPNIYK
ncbi:MAG: hypothetical protein J7K68_02975 [Candidatus Diapherotrites archaeon]|nr:hypothetical protein [Candidatus Diapherotrites archaeon]